MAASFVYFFSVENGPIVKYGLVDARTYKTVDVVLEVVA